VAAGLTYRAPEIPIVSNVTGALAGAEICTPQYWVTHVREPVRFADGVKSAEAAGVCRYLELGPDAVLTGMTAGLTSPGTATLLAALRKDRAEPAAVVSALGGWYASGGAVDWAAVFAGTGARRVGLPTYAFQRQRYWQESRPAAADAGPAGEAADGAFWAAVEREDLAALAGRLGVGTAELGQVVPALATWRRRERDLSTVDSWRYRITWDRIPDRPDRPDGPDGPGRPDPAAGAVTGSWLVALPAGDRPAGLAHAIAETLAARGVRAVPVEIADADRAELAERLRRLASEEAPGGVLSLLALDDRPHPRYPGLSRGAADTITLVQALGDTGHTARTWCVTTGAVAVSGPAEVTSAAQAVVWGLAAGLALDHPDSWGGVVDLAGEADGGVARLCDALSGTEDQVAIRGTGVFARRMIRAPRGAVQLPPVPAPASSGTILITGGTGGLGAHVARMLAARGAEHLVLAGRRGSAAAGVAELAAELAAAGTKVTVAACDVADRDAVAAMLDGLPPVTAVVHAAGAAQRIAPLGELTLDEAAEVCRAKVLGALHLDQLLAGQPLTAFVLFSSGSAAWGSAGQAAYAGANAFLDALAHQRLARGLPATAISWGSWQDGQVDAELAARMRRIGAPAMPPELAIEALRQVLDHGESHLVVADFDWPRFAPTYTLARPRPLIFALPEVRAILDGGAAESEGGSELVQRLAAMTEPEQARAVLDLVRSHVAAVLGYDDPEALDAGRAFTDLGFDSVSAVDLRTRLAAATGQRLAATIVFDYATPAALAAQLRSQLCPAGGEHGLLPVLAELDRFEQAVAGLPAEEIERARIPARLQALATRLTDTPGAADQADLSDRLQSASAADIFQFIDNELGLASTGRGDTDG
jgi:NADP-dependent 3-hydroxy acid dehydrogenase YdfG/malonyl CoA-acyl carrier protein transacylase